MQNAARAAIRRLEIRPGDAVALEVEDPDLRAAVESLLEAAGAEVAAEGREAGAGLVDVDHVDEPPAPQRVRDLVSRVRPGGRVAVVVRRGPGARSVEHFAEHWRPCLDMARAHGEAADGAVVVSGPRRRGLPNDERKRLRGLAHDVEPSVLVGRGGLTPEVFAAAREAVERHGLVKVKLTPQAEIDKKWAARELAWGTGSLLVQRVGKTAVLHRPDVPLDPPVTRSGRR
ncbi:MAG: YhbY family RNA-binding protein [Myxococcota bacterium]